MTSARTARSVLALAPRRSQTYSSALPSMGWPGLLREREGSHKVTVASCGRLIIGGKEAVGVFREASGLPRKSGGLRRGNVVLRTRPRHRHTPSRMDRGRGEAGPKAPRTDCTSSFSTTTGRRSSPASSRPHGPRRSRPQTSRPRAVTSRWRSARSRTSDSYGGCSRRQRRDKSSAREPTSYASSACVATSTPRERREWPKERVRGRVATVGLAERLDDEPLVLGHRLVQGHVERDPASNRAQKESEGCRDASPRRRAGSAGPGAGRRRRAGAPTLVERPSRVDRHHVAVARRIIARILAIDDRPELEVQGPVRPARPRPGRAARRADEVTLGDLDLGDVVVVVGRPSRAPGVMVAMLTFAVSPPG